jgi:DNA-binding transcriptional ArsR family regulator
LPDSPARLSAAPLFAALGDETRLRLIMRLGDDGPGSITRLTAGGALTRQAVTRHLGVLQKAGLVRCARQGRESVWHLERQRLTDAQAWLDARSREWDSRIDRLRAMVED